MVARDRLGVKPLYYAVAGDLVVFASELKSLLASGLVGDALDYEAIDAFLTFGFFPGPSTPLAAVSKLMPGHSLVVEPDGVRVEQYWAYPKPEPRPERSLAETVEGLLEKLEESVRLRLMSDVPLGAMLSGGLDSSLIVALMARNMSEPVKTFSVGFREDGAGNELADARLVANAVGADHHELELSVSEADVDLAELMWHLDEPLADLSALGFLALSELAARHVTVALSGQGADELLGGYAKHKAAAAAARWQRLPGPARAAATSLALRGPKRFRRAARTLAAPGSVDRLLAMSGRARRRPPAGAPPGRARGRRRRVRPPRRDGAPERLPGRPAAGHALHRRAARPRRRHAPLLRPRLDGALARGARAVPRPRARRVLRDDPRGLQGPPDDDQVRPQAGGAGRHPRPDHRQAEDRLLRGLRRPLVRRAGRAA